MDELITSAAAGGSGIGGVLLAWLGFKSRIKNVEKGLKEIQGQVRYEVTCDKITHSFDSQLGDIKRMNKEMRDDIKELLKKP